MRNQTFLRIGAALAFLIVTKGTEAEQKVESTVLTNDLSKKCGETPNIPNTNDETMRHTVLNDWLNCMELGYKDLVDPNKPGGLNFEKVTERQRIIRHENSINMKTDGLNEVTSNIMNLEKVMSSLPRVESLNKNLEDLRSRQKKVNAELGKFINKIWFRSRPLVKEKNEITKEIQAIEKRIIDSNGWLDKDLVTKTIEGQKKVILQSLEKHGLTRELLDKLPPQ